MRCWQTVEYESQGGHGKMTTWPMLYVQNHLGNIRQTVVFLPDSGGKTGPYNDVEVERQWLLVEWTRLPRIIRS